MTHLLVLAETDGTRILPATLPAIAFAQAFSQESTGGAFDILAVGGPEIADTIDPWRFYGAERILVAAAPELSHPTAERVAAICADILQNTEGNVSLAATAVGLGNDILPRVAGLLEMPMVSSVTKMEKMGDRLTFRSPIAAGRISATIQIDRDYGVFSIGSTAYGKPNHSETQSTVELITVDTEILPTGTTWLGDEAVERKRPDLTTARVVVAGGRPLRDTETFERLLGALADKLGGAVGASGGAVNLGIAPTAIQIGQTGKSVAPELYIAVAISGTDQHIAGIKDSQVIVAINSDPKAPIFQVADYGLVADIYQALPELLDTL